MHTNSYNRHKSNEPINPDRENEIIVRVMKAYFLHSTKLPSDNECKL